jgi:hypothetical protein
VDPALFTQEWFDALSDEQRAALLGIFIRMNGDRDSVFDGAGSKVYGVETLA